MKRKSPPRPASELVVRAEAHVENAPPARPLDKAQRLLLAQALERAEAARSHAESALVEFGRWVLVNVFDDDAAAALDEKRGNPVWHELLARAGGPTLRLSRKVVYVALQMAAHDKRITDEAWRTLDATRKELLLPLQDERAMRDAARHVTELKLSQRATGDYVRALRKARGAPATRRRVRGTVVLARLDKLRDDLLEPSRGRIPALIGELDAAGRKRLSAHARSMLSYAQAILRGLER